MKIVKAKELSKKEFLHKFIDLLITLVCYAIVLITVSVLFDSLFIDNSYFGLWAILATLIISILNKTIKPILIWLTLPITGITLGLFYPFINVLILKITDFILGSYFQLKGIIIAFFIAIIISILNMLMEIFIIKPLKKGR